MIQTNLKNPFTTKLSRIVLVFFFVGAFVCLIRYTGLHDWVTLDNMYELVHNYGFWSVFIYWLIFVSAAIMNIPGTGFLLMAILLFGYPFGALYAYIGAMAGAWITFVLGRWMGGKALTDIKNNRIKSLLQQAENKPVRTLIVLRILLQFSPIVGYTLALTNIKQHKYILGNAIGMLLPTVGISIAAYFFEDVFHSFL